jgi:hypothetical protein
MIFVITKGHKMKVDISLSLSHKKAETIYIVISYNSSQVIFKHSEANNFLQLLDSSRISQSIFKGKGVKSMVSAQGKIYIGCIDTSIQELIVANKREKEIKAPTRSWRLQNKPINSVVVYKDMLYSSSTYVEMSNIKDLRRNYEPQMSITAEKGSNIVAMGVVEDFIYLNRSSSANTLQVIFFYKAKTLPS